MSLVLNGFDEGVVKGFDEGVVEGLDEGFVEGFDEGIRVRCGYRQRFVTRQVAMPGAVGIRKGGMEQLAKDPLNPDLGAR